MYPQSPYEEGTWVLWLLCQQCKHYFGRGVNRHSCRYISRERQMRQKKSSRNYFKANILTSILSFSCSKLMWIHVTENDAFLCLITTRTIMECMRPNLSHSQHLIHDLTAGHLTCTTSSTQASTSIVILSFGTQYFSAIKTMQTKLN